MKGERIKEIFYRALDLPASARTEFIREACAGAEDLVEQVTELVRHHDRAGDFLAGGERQALLEEMPASIGGRRVLKRLGQGGFGLVYLAEQERPVRALVAIKLVRPGMGSAEVLARFELERQALERMRHPGIAAVLDAGTTPTGSPYFVLEYVDGETITRHADGAGLGVAARCRLLIDVCMAVQHAHEKGVLHRDIKPGNVLVTEIDGRAQVKVIDFGLAKAIAGSLGEISALTLSRQIVGTPQYMSPEQVSMGARDVDTRSDVYALGVLAYELLAGRPPFAAAELRRLGPAELEVLIRDREPPRPSQAARADDAPAAVRDRARALRGDLDWIVGKAMAKEPDRRYHSAAAIAADLDRHLRGEAVEAGPPGGLYRLGKLVRRHRVLVAATALVLAALVTTIGVSLEAARSARDEQRRTAEELEKYEEVAAFSEQMLVGLDPRVARGADTTLMRRMLAQAAQRLDVDPPRSVEVEIRLRRLVGLGHLAIVDDQEARAQLSRAWELAREHLPRDDVRRLEAAEAWARALAGSGGSEESLALFEEVATQRLQLSGPDAAETLLARSNLAVALGLLGRHEEARAIHEDVVARRGRVLGPDHQDTLASWNNLANEMNELGRNDESLRIFEQVLARQQADLGATDPRTLATMNNLALGYREAGRAAESIAMLRDILAAKRTILPRGHPSIVIGLNNLASALGEQDRGEEAIRILDEALALVAETGSATGGNALILHHNRGTNLRRVGRLDEALAAYEIAADGLEHLRGAAAPDAIGVRLQMIDLLLDLGRAREARELTENLLARKLDGAAAPLRPILHRALGRAELALGRTAAAMAAFEAGLRNLADADDGATAAYRRAVAEVLARAGLDTEAETWRR